MTDPLPRGRFVSLDGIDGTGKTTQVKLLSERLRADGHSVTTCTDPGGTELGAKIRELLLHGRGMALRAEALLFMASRAELVERVIRPALARGEIVVSDRFLLANVVYQGIAGGLDPPLLWRVGEFATGNLEPDLTVVLDLPVIEARKRMGAPSDRLEQRDDAYFEKVREGFRTDRAHQVVVDAAGTVEEVHERIREAVARFLA